MTRRVVLLPPVELVATWGRGCRRCRRDVPAVAARTLLLFGAADERTGSRAARSWKGRIPHARIEMSPDLGHDLLVPLWPRVLQHLAPGTLR